MEANNILTYLCSCICTIILNSDANKYVFLYYEKIKVEEKRLIVVFLQIRSLYNKL